MKSIIALAVVATLAMAPAAQAGGFFSKSSGGLLGNVSAVLGIKDINVLNGTTVAVGNNSSILSNIGSGNGILGLGGQNTSYANSGNTTNVNSGNTVNNNVNSGNRTNVNSGNSQASYWNSFNKQHNAKRW
ncbi:hypothetical protein O9Z70_09710 [Devosia sp. YIM 151766]|uniref:hypothetical protein n=1 Tax=Devosia sp. YIM 151766 TaxID=3017325 RepID=UPI00255C30BB|nr:hypothetical protein [Devosia sp. YIM 151766]WIY51763.1 hypothetical protein O9Z70_09710 [Devosia sp. YIM 151766]